MFTKDTVRGSGRTYRALENLPDGGLFIVHSGDMRRYAQDQLVKMDRRSDAVKILVAGSRAIFEQLKGFQDRPVAVDHAVWELVPADLYFELKDTIRAMRASGQIEYDRVA